MEYRENKVAALTSNSLTLNGKGVAKVLVSVNAQCRMDPDDLEERLRRLLKKRAALHKHILARRAEKVDNTVHLQILNARFAKEVRAMLAEGLTMDQVGQELGMSSEDIFALL